MPAAVRDPLVGALVDGRYEVVSRIAAGGMATVYLATDTRLGRSVALKVMHPHLATDAVFVERFAREARSAARLSHPGIVAVYDQGSDAGTVYLAMEHVPGSTLRELVAHRGALPVGEALDLVASLCDALASAHAADLVHRDVKPENILMGLDGRLRVADFGLARAASASTTAASVLIGTVSYLAPELLTSGRADARADVYAAGVVAFELLTGSLPFTGEVPAQVAFAHVAQDVPVPSSRQRHLPAEVDELVAWATARDAQVRPRDASELAEAVREVRAGLDPEVAVRAPDAPAVVSDGTTRTINRHEHVLALPIGEALEAEVQRTGPLPAITEPTARAPRRPLPRRRQRADDETVRRPAAATTVRRQNTPTNPAASLIAPASATTRAPRVPAAGDTSSGTGSVRTGGGRRRPRPGVLVALLAALVVAGAVVWALLAGPLQRVDVPNVVGSSEAEATATLETRDLGTTTSERYSDDSPVGEVVATEPEAGSGVRPGSEVELVLSRGPRTSAVPDLAGRTLEAARDALEDVGLSVGEVTEAFSEERSDGEIIEQSAPRGDRLRSGSTVDVTVSKGREPIDVPDVRGLSQQDAEQRITEAGLVVGEVTRERDDGTPRDAVIRSDPASGQRFRGDAVALTVSDGPPTVEVPDLVGQPVDQARSTLEGLGVGVQVENVLGGIFGTVRGQSVEAGTQVEPGSSVTLTVV